MSGNEASKNKNPTPFMGGSVKYAMADAEKVDIEKWDRKWKETGSRNPEDNNPDYKFLFKRRIKPSEVEIIRVD